MSKLIRDKIPDIIRENGGTPNIIENVDDLVYQRSLHNKLLEEADEFKRSPSVEEMSDIIEVCLYLCRFYNISYDDVQKYRLEKLHKRGGFDKRILLVEEEPDTLVNASQQQ